MFMSRDFAYVTDESGPRDRLNVVPHSWYWGRYSVRSKARGPIALSQQEVRNNGKPTD